MNEGSGGLHAEEIFIYDFKASIFPANSRFQLYLNWTPCVGRCCDKLVSMFEHTGLRIYAVALHRVETDFERDTTVEKFKLLKSKHILIKPLGKEQFMSLFPEYCDTLKSRLQYYNNFIEERDKETAALLDRI